MSTSFQLLRLLVVGLLIGLLGESASAADIISEIKTRGELVVGLEAQYAPYEFFDKGKIVGYDVDLADIFAKALAVKARSVDTAWAGIIPALYGKKFDCIISGMTITAERAKRVLFSMPYADATNVILVRKDDDRIKTAEDIAGKRVASQLGSAADAVAKSFEAHLKTSAGKGFTEYKLFDHFTEAYIDLDNKRVDAVINSLSPLLVLMREQPGKYRIIEGVQAQKAYFGMAFRQGDEALRDFVNEQLRRLKEGGELKQLQVKWFGFPMDTPMEIPKDLP